MTETADVVVVGAGVIGCAVAHELARRGARVVVLDARAVGQGATRASAGILAPFVESHAGSPLHALGGRSLALYDAFVARAAQDSGAAVDYRRAGTLEAATDEVALERLKNAAAGHAAAGVPHELLDAPAVHEAERELAADVLGGLLVPAHGCVAAGELTAALARAAVRRGAALVSPRAVRRIVREGGALRVETDGEAASAAHVVLAAGSWSGRLEVAGAAKVPVRPVRGQLLHLTWPGPALARIVWAPGCYLVPWSDGSLLVGATVEEVGFDERATVAGVWDLLEAACAIVPRTWRAGFREVRVGLRPATPDELPVVGPSRAVPGLVYATGHYRNGVLLAPLTAVLVADLLLDGRSDPALGALSPARFGDC